MLGFSEYKNFTRPIKGLEKVAVMPAPSGDSAFHRYLAYAEKCNVPNVVAIIKGEIAKAYGGVKMAEEKIASEPEKTTMAETVVNHVMGKLASDTTPEETLQILSLIGQGIDKLASNQNDVDSNEFINKVTSSIDDGTFFEIFNK